MVDVVFVDELGTATASRIILSTASRDRTAGRGRGEELGPGDDGPAALSLWLRTEPDPPEVVVIIVGVDMTAASSLPLVDIIFFGHKTVQLMKTVRASATKRATAQLGQQALLFKSEALGAPP